MGEECPRISMVSKVNNARKAPGVMIADMFIAGTALVLDASLASKNQKDFRFIKGLKFKKYLA